MESIKDVIKKNTFLNKELQSKYNLKKTYASKLIFIYLTLLKSQSEYLKFKKDSTFTPKYLKILLKNLKNVENLDDNKFVEFVFENIIKFLPSSHVSIKPVVIEASSQNSYIQQEENPQKPNEEKNISYCLDSNMPETLTIKIKCFSKNFLEKDKEVFEEIEKEIKSKDIQNVIFDLRGNGGGTDEYFKYFSIFTKKSISLKERYKNLFLGENIECETKYIEGNSENKEFNRFLLVDKNVFSTAETFTILCKQNGFATVIGEKTKGEGFGLTPLSLQITNSKYTGKFNEKNAVIKGIKITIPVEAPINEKGEVDYQNCYNTTPHIVCDSKDAMQIAYKQIQNLKEENLFQQM